LLFIDNPLIDRPQPMPSGSTPPRYRHGLAAIVLACAVGTALAAPPSPEVPSSSIDTFLAERNLLPRLVELRDSVSTTTSDLVMTAMGFLGVRYQRGGTDETTGFDCSGFVRAVYEKTLGLALPHRAAEQANVTAKISSEELRPGDLVFFNTMRRAFSHVGIYVGEGKFIHSPRAGGKVRVEDMREAYWSKRFNGARRVEGTKAEALMQNLPFYRQD